MNRIIRVLRRDPLRKYDLKPGEPFGVSGSWVAAPDGMSLLPAPAEVRPSSARPWRSPERPDWLWACTYELPAGQRATPDHDAWPVAGDAAYLRWLTQGEGRAA